MHFTYLGIIGTVAAVWILDGRSEKMKLLAECIAVLAVFCVFGIAFVS
jgi:hypothetical protein